MEHDSWDQLILARLLAHFAATRRPRILELIVVSEYPGSTRFLGIGQLPPESLRLLWQTRRPVTPAQLSVGAAAWQALGSPDPRALAAIASSGTPDLPVLAPALHRHLRELPSTEHGLSLTETLILRILADEGTMTMGGVFRLLSYEREPLPFLSDAAMAYVVREMERAGEPPLVWTASPGERLFANRLTLTDAGRSVLNGARDWHDLGPHPRWVGGIHVQPGEPGWRWSESTRTAISSAR
jgi:DNA-binding MarR family transcriptional regulator